MKKERGTSSYRGFLFHLHPPKVAEASIQFNRTFGLGGMALLLFVIQLISGVLLRFVYIPTPAEAYDSILYINNEILFGGFIRNVHHWSGAFFVIVSFLHFIRVFYSQAIFKPRRVNWLIGMGLFVLVIISNFTGYLLPWDQLSFWAVMVATSMFTYIPVIGDELLLLIRGGNEVGWATLLNFYNFHTGLLPIAMAVLMIWHFWKVRKAKGVAVPHTDENIRVPTNPNLLLKELVVGLILIAFIFLLAAFFNAPLQERANPAFSPNPAKAPWYFLGIQELLLHLHPFFAFVVLPLVFFGGLIWYPYAVVKGNPGHWFHSVTGKRIAVYSALLTIVFTPGSIIIEEYYWHFESWLPAVPQYISEGLIPVSILIFTFGVYIFLLIKRFKAQKHEVMIGLFTIFIISYVILTITGIWFRGEGMKLMWPWEI